MSKRFRRGIIVGKFSPLHLGHERLIARAEADCDHVLVLSYSKPEFPPAVASVREGWLRARKPKVQSVVLDDARLAELCQRHGQAPRRLPENAAPGEVHREFVGWLLLQCLQTTVDAVFTSEAYGDGFAASLTTQFQQLNPDHPDVVHVNVDSGRLGVSVSGTAVRADPGHFRSHVSHEVYADLVPRVCILGGESSGKTTLATSLAARLETVLVAEYGRERWAEVGGVLSAEELVGVGRVQVEREIEAAQAANRWLVCDTSPLTTLVYCLIDHGEAPAELRRLARRRYDVTVLCEPDFDFVQDGSRRDDNFRRRQHDLTRCWLNDAGIAFVAARGDIARRVAHVLERLEAHS